MTDPIQVSELLPCPYCGDPMEWNHDVDGFMHTPRSADIGKCYLRHNYYHRGQLDWWNTRAMKAAEPLPQGDEVERVAIALSSKLWAVGNSADKSDCGGWEELPVWVQEIYREAARAAIAALVRSPQGGEVERCSDCGNIHDPDIRCPNYHAGMMPTARAALVRRQP